MSDDATDAPPEGSGDAVDGNAVDSDSTATDDATDSLDATLAENEGLARLVDRADTLNDVLDVVDLAMAALDDEMVERLAATGTAVGEVADTATTDETARGLVAVLEAVGESTEAAQSRRERGTTPGTLDLLRDLRDPDVRRGLAFLVDAARTVGRKLE